MASVFMPTLGWMVAGFPLRSHVEHGGEPHEDEADHADARYDFETFRTAVTEGRHPDGELLSDDMPRWEISEADLADLADYLQSFPAP